MPHWRSGKAMPLSNRDFLSEPTFGGRFVGIEKGSYGPYGYVEATSKQAAIKKAAEMYEKYSRVRTGKPSLYWSWTEFRFYWRVPVWSVTYD